MVDQPDPAAAARARSRHPRRAARGTRAIEGIADTFRSTGYIAERSLATTVFLALELGRPLLLEGEAGVGKTELAKVLAPALGARADPAPVLRGPGRQHRRLRVELPAPDARDPAARGARRDRHGDRPTTSSAPEFLLKRPLLQALEADEGAAPVLLIDEIDRADEEFEAYLLEILSDFQVTVPEIGTIRAERPPRVVLTSNRTREVHDALKRRCLYHWIDYPTAAKEFEIVRPGAGRAGAPGARGRRVRPAAARGRSHEGPGVAETLDWAAALLSLGAAELGPDVVDETLGVVLKYEEDIRQVRGATARQYLAEAGAAPEPAPRSFFSPVPPFSSLPLPSPLYMPPSPSLHPPLPPGGAPTAAAVDQLPRPQIGGTVTARPRRTRSRSGTARRR